jgi:hypothetical protein
VDAKIGFQFLSLAQLSHMNFINGLGIHAMVGTQSLGISISWRITKFLENTRIHLYSGYAYSGKPSYGLGMSLNF